MKIEIMVVGLPGEKTYAFLSAEEMIENASKLGWTFQCYETQSHLLKTLQGLPKFTELHGPMDNGTSVHGVQVIRYETWPASQFYSS